MNIKFVILVIFFGLWLSAGIYLTQKESPTFDEPIHLKAGQLYTEGNFDFDPIEPPLVRLFVYTVGVRLERLTGQSPTLLPYRAVVIIANGLLLSYLLSLIINKSLPAGFLAAFLILTDANLLAHGHYFTTDLVSSVAAFICANLILKEIWKTKKEFSLLIIFVALATATKVASLALIGPVLLIKLPRLGRRKFLILISLVFLLVWSTYGFQWQTIFNHSSLNLPFGGYLRAIKENYLFAKRGQPIFFQEQLSSFSPIFKTPLTILFKTSLPLLLLALWGVVSNLGTRKNFRTISSYLIIFGCVFIVGLVKPLSFGIRHLLIAEIGLIFIATQLKIKTLPKLIVLFILLAWQVAGFAKALPQPITFTNELAGRQPYRIFTDSDLDWGQGLIELKNEISLRKIDRYQLAYFGNVNPANYLPSFTRIKDSNPVGSLPIEPLDYDQTIIISVTCYYQCGYYLDPKLKSPSLIAKSFLIFNDN